MTSLVHAQKSPAFMRLRELTVLVTPLLGLKSQLELASVARFTTHLGLGHIPKFELLNYCIADIAVSMVEFAFYPSIVLNYSYIV